MSFIFLAVYPEAGLQENDLLTELVKIHDFLTIQDQ